MSDKQTETGRPNTEANLPDTHAHRKMTGKQIATVICILLLIGLYVGAFLVACFGSSGQLFAGVLGSMVGLPILLWLLLWSLQLMKKRREENLPPQHTDSGEDSE